MSSCLRFVFSCLCCDLLVGVAARAQPAADLVLPRIVQTRDPVFPPSLEASGFSSGEVHVAIKVGATGKLDDLLVTAYTRKEFADETVKAIRTWTFEPARVGGEAVGWVRNLQIHFETNGIRVVADNPDHPAGRLAVLTSRDDHFAYRACSLKELDRSPVLHHVVEPQAFPRNSSKPVVIEFYIDELGRVRLPGVREGEDAAFANAALDAVTQWEFDPPTRAGQPVLVRASQTFRVELAAASGKSR
jgi:TonB family protein